MCRQPWQGNTDIMIDRYDVRTHIDYIPETPLTHRTYVASLAISCHVTFVLAIHWALCILPTQLNGKWWCWVCHSDNCCSKMRCVKSSCIWMQCTLVSIAKEHFQPLKWLLPHWLTLTLTISNLITFPFLMLTEMVFGCRLLWIARVCSVVWWSTKNCMVARGVRIVVKCRPGTRIDFKQVLWYPFEC